MIMQKGWKRPVRVIGTPGETRGYVMQVIDVESGEMITNVRKAVITLVPEYANTVELTYYEADPQTGALLGDPTCKPISRHIVLFNPEVDVTAFERNG